MKTGVPIKPSQLPQKERQEDIPPFVYDVINDMLCEQSNGKDPITLSENAIISRVSEVAKREFDTKWLSFEKAYSKQGWIVSYIKSAPGSYIGSTYLFTQN